MKKHGGIIGQFHPEDGPPTPFGGVKIFNERSGDFQVAIALCKGRGGAAAASTLVPVPANTPSDQPVQWQPDNVQNVLAVKVDTYQSDGTTMIATFGPTGVGLAGGPTQTYLVNLQITLGSDGSVKIDMYDSDWNEPPLRTASISPNSPPMSTWFNVTCVRSGGNFLVSYDPTNVANGNGLGQVGNAGSVGSQWQIVPMDPYPPGGNVGQVWIESNYDSSHYPVAIARYVGADGTTQLAGMAWPPSSPYTGPHGTGTDGLLVIQYQDGAGGPGIPVPFQIVDLATGLALTSPNVATDPSSQLTFLAPDPSPPGWNVQLWTFTPPPSS